MGWLHWTHEQTLATDMQAIERGYRGRLKMLQAMNGRAVTASRPVADSEPTGPPMTSKLMRAMFGRK